MPYWNDYHGANPIAALRQEYNPQQVENGIESARRDLIRIQEFLRHAEARREELLHQEYVDITELRRHADCCTKRVEYFVTVRRQPVINGKPSHASAFYPHSNLSKRFTGKERKAAIAYAQELSAAHGGCWIESDLTVPGGAHEQ